MCHLILCWALVHTSLHSPGAGQVGQGHSSPKFPPLGAFQISSVPTCVGRWANLCGMGPKCFGSAEIG